jgi:peptidoglycan hydrolase-like protein with peptidoglycan-binding domain
VQIVSLIAQLNGGRFLGGALLVAGAVGIAANALLLQPVAHPDPLMLTRADVDVIEQPNAAASGEQGDARGAQRDELVLVIQNALREEGYYSGEIDGIAGPKTLAAVRRFEAAAGSPASAAADAGPSAATAPSDPDQGSADLIAAPDDTVAAVQGALARAAYGPLRADGIFGPQTGDAIRRFQRDHGLPVTGEITDALIVELRASGALEDE